ncbi:MAG: amino acid ABC transporter substrate-binding protein [Ignavibacteriae bacterium]|nr:amino acid ABC transporter substrate-binding protein [Ignavibacteriota bacterium]
MFKKTSIILLCSFVFFCCNTKKEQIQQSESVYENVVSSQKLRCAYIPYPPATIKDPNTGELSGIFVDIIKEAVKNMGFKIEWTEEVGWGTMIEGLEANRYDIVVTGVWPNAARAVRADFSVPLYYSGVGVYVRTNDNRFNNDLSLINNIDIRVSTMDGEINELIANSQFPKAKKVSIPQLSDFNQILFNVSQNKADVTFVETYVANQFLEANPGSVRNIAKDKPLRVTPNTYLLKKGEYKFTTMINTALEELINTGFVDQVIEKYEKFPGSLYRVNYAYKPNK